MERSLCWLARQTRQKHYQEACIMKTYRVSSKLPLAMLVLSKIDALINHLSTQLRGTVTEKENPVHRLP